MSADWPQRMLRRLAESDAALTPAQLAEALGASPAMIAQIAGQLARLGYLAENSACNAACGACSLQGLCGGKSPNAAPQLWVLTAKGRRAAKKIR